MLTDLTAGDTGAAAALGAGLGLAGRNIVVTGGTRGIGGAVSRTLADLGANLTVCYRGGTEAADALRAELAGTSGDHHVLQADVSDPEQVRALAEHARTAWGRVDVLVHNAGTITHTPFADLPLAEWNQVVDTSLTAAYTLTRELLPLVPDGGSLIYVGSRVAMVGIPLRAHYTAAKAGLVGLVRSLAKELGPRGIRANVVGPGVIETEEFARMTPEQYARTQEVYRAKTALGRLGRPPEVAGVVAFLAGDLSTYVTGETIHVDGGI